MTFVITPKKKHACIVHSFVWLARIPQLNYCPPIHHSSIQFFSNPFIRCLSPRQGKLKTYQRIPSKPRELRKLGRSLLFLRFSHGLNRIRWYDFEAFLFLPRFSGVKVTPKMIQSMWLLCVMSHNDGYAKHPTAYRNHKDVLSYDVTFSTAKSIKSPIYFSIPSIGDCNGIYC